ncbi:conserved oligomeric Golgi complex subunit 4-like isoform X2 [Hylaeus volcanicus]|uniref:conserved oligomeric Golgi complex subunit 4-like isoform X2 n=1 Tax=Hylaeus volcanicus TaxID=313075 RepID=UPI0023B776E5|nr:conserved oligomeric Golgi complex subunit 4-like isoform X2 [Hylaeus volcanicus]
MTGTEKTSSNLRDELQESIQNTENLCVAREKELYRKLNQGILSIKERLVDEDINTFCTLREKIADNINKFSESFSNLNCETKHLKEEISYVETLKKSLDKALLYSLQCQRLQKCETLLGKSMEDNDFESSVRSIQEMHDILDNNGSLRDSNKHIVSSMQCFERNLIEKFQQLLVESILHNDLIATRKLCQFLKSLKLQKLVINNYLSVLKNSMQSQIISVPNFGNKEEYQLFFQKYPFYFADTLIKLFTCVKKFIEEHHSTIITVLSNNQFLLLLRQIEKEADNQAVPLLTEFQRKNHKIINSSPETLNFSALRETDVLLEEMSIISSRVQQFVLFLHSKSQPCKQAIEEHSSEKAVDLISDPNVSCLHGLAELSSLSRQSQEIMGLYVSLEHAYALVSLRKASDEAYVILGDYDRLGTTFPDDVFFILRKVIIRSIETHDNCALCAVINFLSALISSTMKATLTDSLATSFQFYTTWMNTHFLEEESTISQKNTFHKALDSLINKPERLGELTSMLKWSASLQQLPSSNNKAIQPVSQCSVKLSWPHLLNDLCTCYESIENLGHLSEDHFSAACLANETNTLFQERQSLMFQQSLLSLLATKKEYWETLDYYVQLFVNQPLSPLLTSFFNEFLTIPSILDDTMFADFQVNDPFIKKFIMKINQIINHIQTTYTLQCSNLLIDALINNMAVRFEDCILKKKFSLLGAVQLEADLRAFMNFLTQKCSRPYISKFTKLMDITELLCVSSHDEFNAIIDSLKNERTLTLSDEEIKKLIENRVDFTN